MFNVLKEHQIGRSHIKKSIPCQDYTNSWVSDDESFAISVLCDGAGSCSQSDLGAKSISDWFIDYIKAKSDVDFTQANNKYAFLRDLQIKLLQTSSLAKCNYKDLSSTFLGIVANKIDEDIEFTSFHIGDGIIAITNSEETSILSEPENGQFANETTFTTSNKAYDSLRIIKGKVCLNSSFVLMSDGASDCLYKKKDKTFSDNIKKLHTLARNEKLEPKDFSGFVDMLRDNTNTGDDCSLVLMYNSYTPLNNEALKIELIRKMDNNEKLRELNYLKEDFSDLKKELGITRKNLKFIYDKLNALKQIYLYSFVVILLLGIISLGYFLVKTMTLSSKLDNEISAISNEIKQKNISLDYKISNLSVGFNNMNADISNIIMDIKDLKMDIDEINLRDSADIELEKDDEINLRDSTNSELENDEDNQEGDLEYVIQS